MSCKVLLGFYWSHTNKIKIFVPKYNRNLISSVGVIIYGRTDTAAYGPISSSLWKEGAFSENFISVASGRLAYGHKIEKLLTMVY
jgi:hypothetical protein